MVQLNNINLLRSATAKVKAEKPCFWEHTIRDEADLKQHLDYIHYNPVKHGLISCPHLWEYSSFYQWVRQGKYLQNWGCVCSNRKKD